MKEHVQSLIDDLTESFDRNYCDSDKRGEVENYSTYFLGNIILFNDSEDNYIIDGQQRLTSLTLIFLYLRNQLKTCTFESNGHGLDIDVELNKIDELIVKYEFGTESFKLNFGEFDEFLKAKFDESSFEPDGKSTSVKNMYERYGDIQQHWPDGYSGTKLLTFLDWLRDNVKVVEIKTSSEYNAYTIFETANNRGLALRPADLLKSYLLSKIDEGEKNQIAEKWNETILKLNESHIENNNACIRSWAQ